MEARFRSRPMVCRLITVRPANIRDAIPREAWRRYADKVIVAPQDGYHTLVSIFFMESWESGALFFDNTWADVGADLSMVYRIIDDIRAGVMVLQHDLFVGNH